MPRDDFHSQLRENSAANARKRYLLAGLPQARTGAVIGAANAVVFYGACQWQTFELSGLTSVKTPSPP